jgi:hypothetical protein
MKNKNNTMLAKQNKKQKYYIVGTKLKTKNITLSEQNEKQNTTLSEQSEKQKILHCRNKVFSFCSDSVVFFVFFFIPTV